MGRLALILPLLVSIASCTQPLPVEITEAWARDTIGRTANAAVFMTISSRTSDRLIGASTPIARKTDLMTMGGGNAMQMQYLDEIQTPADKAVSLNPSGLHIWLAGLHRPLKAGQRFPLTLNFEKAGERKVEVLVIGPADAPPSSGA